MLYSDLILDVAIQIPMAVGWTLVEYFHLPLMPFFFSVMKTDLYQLRQCYLRQQHECTLLKHSSQSLLILSLNKASGHTCLLISHEHKSLGHLFMTRFQLKMVKLFFFSV